MGMTKQEEMGIAELRNRLLELGESIVIPAREQVGNADEAPPAYLIVYPIFEKDD